MAFGFVLSQALCFDSARAVIAADAAERPAAPDGRSVRGRQAAGAADLVPRMLDRLLPNSTFSAGRHASSPKGPAGMCCVIWLAYLVVVDRLGCCSIVKKQRKSLADNATVVASKTLESVPFSNHL